MRTILPLTLLLAPLFAACGGSDSEAASGSGGGLDGATVAQQRCSLCHHLDGSQSMFAPGLPTVIGQARARVADYPKIVDGLKSLSEASYVDARDTIDTILAAEDDEERLRLWLRAHVKNPRFDNPVSRMAPVAVSEREFDALWSYLRTIR
jgi:cytochrome c2